MLNIGGNLARDLIASTCFLPTIMNNPVFFSGLASTRKKVKENYNQILQSYFLHPCSTNMQAYQYRFASFGLILPVILTIYKT